MPKSSMLWYLSHPVRPDERYTAEQNLDHTLVVLKILWDAGFNVIAPWHSLCLALKNEPHDAAVIERALRLDCDVVKSCDGIILTGHRKSNGMERELEGLAPFSSLFNLIGIADSQLADMALQLLEEKYAPR
jgi:hypothetical protein